MGVDHEFNITPCDRIFSVYWNLYDLSMVKYGPHMSEPLIQGHAQNFVDPLLQAIVLTAIVIGFGMTAFLLVLIYRTYRVTKEDEISALKGDEDDE